VISILIDDRRWEMLVLATAAAAGVALQQPTVRMAAPTLIRPRLAEPTRMALKLNPEEASRLLEDGPASSQGPFGEGGALEWVAKTLDKAAEDTLSILHAWDDKAVQDSSKNLQVLWSRAVLARLGELDDPIAYDLLPKSTRGVVDMGIFDGVGNFLEWVAARTAFLNEGTDAFLSSPSCAGGKECQVVVFGAGFDTRSIRYQREGLRFFEVDLPDTIEAKRVVHERYQADENPSVRLPARVGFDLNDCEHTSLLDTLEAEHGLRRDVPTLFISEAVMFYVNPRAIAALYHDIFSFGQGAEAMYCFTDSMRPLVNGPFSDEVTRFLGKQGVATLGHQARWSGAVQFVHAVARTPGVHDASPTSLLKHVAARVEAPINSYAPERAKRDASAAPTFNNTWYAVAYASELSLGKPYATRLFGEPLTLTLTTPFERSESGDAQADVECAAPLDGRVYAAVVHQELVYVWRGAPAAADTEALPTHPTPEATHCVETILDYGCDWSYIVENNLDTPHLYWLHDGSIPPIDPLGCNRGTIGGIGLRFFADDVGVGHIGKTKTKTTKVVRFDAPNVVRHGGVSGFSEEFNIVPIGPHRTRVLLRQRFPKGPILTTLLKIPGTRQALQFLVRNWNYQIGLEDYCVMQGQAHNIDDLGAPNWQATSTGDDLILRFWKWKQQALRGDSVGSEYYTRWDGSAIDPDAVDYPPVNWRPYPLIQGIIDRHGEALDLEGELKRLREDRDVEEVKGRFGLPAALGAAGGIAAGAGVLSATNWFALAMQAPGVL
jgi:O-methyltransferase involved in polyketide biosynthesis